VATFCRSPNATHHKRRFRAQAFIHPDNNASRRLVEKLVFRCEANLRASGVALRHVFALLEFEHRNQT
jgi:RimJ/RimL family protein N-acetyltransferase